LNPWRGHGVDRNGRRYSWRGRGPKNYIRGWLIVLVVVVAALVVGPELVAGIFD
jgi:hypothetical protein